MTLQTLYNILSWINDSQLLATIIGLGLGTFLIERMHQRRCAELETLRWLINLIERYDTMGCEYWQTFSGDEVGRRSELAARLKVDYAFLAVSVDNIKMVKDAERKQMKEQLERLYDAATGDDFEVDRKFSIDEIRMYHVRIARASAAVKKILYGAMTK